MMGRREFAQMKAGAYFINTARTGPLVDYDALDGRQPVGIWPAPASTVFRKSRRRSIGRCSDCPTSP